LLKYYTYRRKNIARYIPNTCHVCTENIQCTEKASFSEAQDSICFAWVVWFVSPELGEKLHWRAMKRKSQAKKGKGFHVNIEIRGYGENW